MSCKVITSPQGRDNYQRRSESLRNWFSLPLPHQGMWPQCKCSDKFRAQHLCPRARKCPVVGILIASAARCIPIAARTF